MGRCSITQQPSNPKPLNRDQVEASIRFNAAYPNRWPSYTVPLPNWNHKIFVGAMVRPPNGNAYTIVEIAGDWAVLVPVVFSLDSPPAAAYTMLLSKLTPTSIEEMATITEEQWQEVIALPANGREQHMDFAKRASHFPENFTQSAVVIAETRFGIFKRSHVLGVWRAAERVLEYER
jgi:hypothetical protein